METAKEELVLVSVIIPVYNVEKYLEECLDSVINQTYEDIEIICVNDGSTDSSLEILQKYANIDSRVIIVNKENGGSSSARNEGIRQAKGKYIYFLDSDDYIVCNTLELLVNQSEKEELDILFFGAKSFFDSPEMEKEHEVYKDYYVRKQLFTSAVSGDRMLERMMKQRLYRCSVPLQFIRRAFLLETGIWFTEGIMHEDELFSALLLVRAQRVRCSTDTLYMRRVRDNSIMTSVGTSRRFVSLYIVSMTLAARAIVSADYTECGRWAISTLARWKYRHALETYRDLPKKERSQISSQIPKEYMLLYEEMKFSFELHPGQRENAEVLRIKNSYSYRIGRAITFFPRKVKGGIQCYYDNGLVYTVKHTFEKMVNGAHRIKKKLH